MLLQTLSCARLVFRTDVLLEEYFVPCGTDDIQTRMENILDCIHFGKNTLWNHTYSTTTLYKNFGSKIVCVLPKKCIFSNCTRYNLKNTLFEKVHPRRKHFENIRINHNFYVCVDMPSNLSHVLFRMVGIAKL